ncbi:hypothetical protein SBA4_2990016 [Candidatus Sulfopaludibacter sp. SbA4]|nr:hypothetical protein SBA4_2990016 [Candidatus Sulfopaludibacter sp. SbA4]
MSKKWYNLFVSVDQPAEEAPETDGEPAPAAAPASAAQAVADIAAGISKVTTFTTPVSNAASFDEIYSAAEIHPPAHGFTVMKVADMLHSEHIRNLPRDVKRSSVLVALEASGAPIQDVIEDAVKRDRALDTFERVQERSVTDLEARKTKENQEIQAEMDRLAADHKARIQANNDELAKERERFYAWRLKKQEEEQKISDTVSYFVTDNPITTGGPAAAPAPASRERTSGAATPDK